MIAFDAEPRFAAAKGPNGRRLVAEIREDDARVRRRVAFGLLVLAALAIAITAALVNTWLEVQLVDRLEAQPTHLRVMDSERLMIGRTIEQDA